MTCDVLMECLTPTRAFRLNYDLVKDYSIEISPAGFRLSSSHQSVTDKEISKVLWRKPFNEGFEIDTDEDPYVVGETQYIFREVFNLLSLEGKRVFGWPSADRRLGKLCQMRAAAKYFTVPEYRLVHHDAPVFCPTSTIVKSLSSRVLKDGRVVYASDVTGQTLAPGYPWFTQTKVSAAFDVTSVFVVGRVFSFRLNRSLFDGLDWRKEVFEMGKLWDQCDLGLKTDDKIRAFMDEVGLTFGRIDFLANDKMRDLVFLEVNPNGQWGWLDPHRTNGLLEEIVSCLDPDNPKGFAC